MRTPFLPILGATLLALAGGHVAPANADIILDTFDEGGAFHPTDNAGAAKASGQNPVPTATSCVAQCEIFDLNGRRVATLLNDRQLSAGTHSLQWDGKDTKGRSVAPGIYTLRVLADGGEARRRVVVIP